MRKYVLISLILSMALSRLAFGGLNRWSSIGPKTGGITQFAFHPSNPNLIYGHIYGQSISSFVRSFNTGQSWQNSGISFAGMIRVDPFGPDSILAIDASVLQSSNRGVSWNEIAHNSFGYYKDTDYPNEASDFEFHTTKPGILYATASGFFFKSTDAGRRWKSNWQRSETPIDVYSICVDPTDGDHVLLMGINYLYESKDAGNSFIVKTHRLAACVISHNHTYCNSVNLEMDPSNVHRLYALNNYSIYKSLNGGDSWSEIVSGYQSKLWIDPFDGNHLVAGLETELSVSFDAGDSWKHLAGISGYADAFAFHPTIRGFALASTEAGIYRSLNGGQTWQHFRGTDDKFLALVQPVSAHPGTLLAYNGYDKSYQRTENDGKSWRTVALPIGGGVDLQIHPTNSNFVVVGGFDGLSISRDSGITWSAPSGPHVSKVAFDPRDPTTIFGVILTYSSSDPHGITRSTDQGKHWVTLNQGIPQEVELEAIAVDPQNGNRVVVTTDAGIYESTNKGEHWHLLFQLDCCALDNIQFHPQLSNILFLDNSGELSRSTDRGRTWKTTGLHYSQGVAFDPNDPRVIFAFGSGIDVSSDFGEHFSVFDSNGLKGQVSVNSIAVSPWDRSRLYLCDSGIYEYDRGFPTHGPDIINAIPGYGRQGQKIVLKGTNFGFVRGDGSVKIHGMSAVVDEWANNRIVFQVPEISQTGALFVTTNGIKSNSFQFPIVGENATPSDGSAAGGDVIVLFAHEIPGYILFGSALARQVRAVELAPLQYLIFCSAPAGHGSVPITIIFHSDSPPVIAGTFVYH